jgi:uncharacterized protein involved in type VI secretion and phage assembly
VANKTIAQENYLERLDRGKKWGVYVGIVTDNKDKDGKYRVKVRIPAFDNGSSSGESSFWYRCTTWGAGPNRGFYNLPEVNDEVLVAFEHGEVSHGYVIGSCWNNTSTAIGDNKGGKNDDRWFKSRSGNIIKMGDGSTTGILLQSTGGHIVHLDDGGQILIKHSSGSSKITLTADSIKCEASNEILLKAGSKITMQSGGVINGTSSGNTQFKAGGNFGVQAGGKIMLMAGGQGAFVCGGTITINGPTVNIN